MSLNCYLITGRLFHVYSVTWHLVWGQNKCPQHCLFKRRTAWNTSRDVKVIWRTFCQNVGKKKIRNVFIEIIVAMEAARMFLHSFIYLLWSAPQNSSLLTSNLTSGLRSLVSPRQQVLLWVDFLCSSAVASRVRWQERTIQTLSNAALRAVSYQCPDQGHSNAEAMLERQTGEMTVLYTRLASSVWDSESQTGWHHIWLTL